MPVPPRNDRSLALRIGVLAFLANNLTIGAILGTFGVTLSAVELRLGVGREVSSMGMALLTLSCALLAPLTGALATRFSIRSLLLVGSLLGIAGFALLAFTKSAALYLAAYALLLAPALCFCGTMLAPTLVTRWFTANRGRALGIVHLPIVVACAPLISSFVLHRYGLPAVYKMLMLWMALNLVAQCFVIDFPPGETAQTADGTAPAQPDHGMSALALLRSWKFWPIVLAYAAIISGGGSFLNTQIVVMAMGWGIGPIQAASLITFTSIAGMCGGILAGWLSDRLSGTTTQAILCLLSIPVWACLIVGPSYLFLAFVVMLTGLATSGAVPSVSVALTDHFGVASFPRAFGLAQLACLPFTLAVVPISAYVYVHEGNYRGAIVLQMVLFGLAFLGLLPSLSSRLRFRHPATPAAS